MQRSTALTPEQKGDVKVIDLGQRVYAGFSFCFVLFSPEAGWGRSTDCPRPKTFSLPTETAFESLAEGSGSGLRLPLAGSPTPPG